MKIFLIKKGRVHRALYHGINRVRTSLWRMCLLTEKEGKENKEKLLLKVQLLKSTLSVPANHGTTLQSPFLAGLWADNLDLIPPNPFSPGPRKQENTAA